jgi:hypothetical protein
MMNIFSSVGSIERSNRLENDVMFVALLVDARNVGKQRKQAPIPICQ